MDTFFGQTPQLAEILRIIIRYNFLTTLFGPTRVLCLLGYGGYIFKGACFNQGVFPILQMSLWRDCGCFASSQTYRWKNMTVVSLSSQLMNMSLLNSWLHRCYWKKPLESWGGYAGYPRELFLYTVKVSCCSPYGQKENGCVWKAYSGASVYACANFDLSGDLCGGAIDHIKQS